MINNRSTLKINVEILSENGKTPQTTEIIYPNLRYSDVLMIERALIGALLEMNDSGRANLENIKLANPVK